MEKGIFNRNTIKVYYNFMIFAGLKDFRSLLGARGSLEEIVIFFM